jgi:hypothetical protein
MIFPALYSQNCRVQLDADQKAQLYNDGILPALVVPEDAQNWPPTYKDAMFRAKNKNGTHQFGTKPLSSWDVGEYGMNLRLHLTRKHTWARDFVYMIQIKGVKEAHRHNPNLQDAQYALQQFTENLDARDGTWFVDVGLEISEEENAYQWRTDSHATILEEATGLSQEDSVRLTNVSSRHYQRDRSSHLLDLSGCRIDLPANRKGPWRAEYVQLYTTDKSVVYHLEKGRHSKFMTGNEALQGCPPKFLTELYDLFFNCRDRVDCAARIELRVPLESGPQVLLDFPPDVKARTLVVFPRKVWW